MRYAKIHIIYNPNSTGPSQAEARALKQDLLKSFPAAEISLNSTKYAGHAEKLAFKFAGQSKRPLIVSSSGDGGYNEVINGAVRAQLKGARPVCAVLPAGNANDHSRTLQARPLLKAILAGVETKMDLLKAGFNSGGQPYHRYAHSYIGLGLTPVTAVELNKTSLNALKELWIVLKTFYKFRPFKILYNGNAMTLDSILFTNISQMAKVFTMAKNAKTDDGLFEIVTFPHDHKLKLVRKLAKASVTGLEPDKKYARFEFNVVNKMPVQLDGEVSYIDKGSAVVIESKKQILTTVV